MQDAREPLNTGPSGLPVSTEPVMCKKLLAARRLQFTPALVGAAQQRHVRRVLGVSEPDDAADAMRRPSVVGDVETLQTQHAKAAACKLIHRRGAHRAHADDDDVVGTVGGHGCETGTGRTPCGWR